MESSLQRQGSRVRFAEEEPEPGLEVYHPQPVRKARGNIPPVVASTAAASPEPATDKGPDVYWADDNENDPNASKYTFYREGTPTPPEYEEHVEKGGFGGFAAATSSHRPPTPPIATRGTPGIFPPFDPGRENDGLSSDGSQYEEIPASKKRKYRWVIILLASLFIIVPIAVGTGVGVGLRKPSSLGPEAANRFVNLVNR